MKKYISKQVIHMKYIIKCVLAFLQSIVVEPSFKP